jgi:hypothetical protein
MPLRKVACAHAAHVHLEGLAALAEALVQVEDAVGDLVRPPGEHHPTRLELRIPAGRCEPRAPDLRGTDLEHAELVLEVRGLGLAIVLGDEAVDGDGDGGCVGRVRGSPTLPGLSTRRPATTRSVGSCVWPPTTQSAVTPSSRSAMSSSEESESKPGPSSDAGDA